MVSLEDLKVWLIQMKTELADMPLINRTYFENIRYTKQTKKIAELEASIWIQENPDDYDGFISRLPKGHLYASKDIRNLNVSFYLYKNSLIKYNKTRHL
jgi:hypothetical protein